MKVSVVIPAYNEEKDIVDAVWDVVHLIPDAEIIVVNDASTDKTLEKLLMLQDTVKTLTIIDNPTNRGHGYSVIKGIKVAKGDFIIYIDADRQIQLSEARCKDAADVISGYRVNRHDKPFRLFISFCLKLTNFLWHHYLIPDANCPLKIYKREAILPLIDKLPKSYIVPIACLDVLARKEGLKVITVPVTHYPYPGKRKGFLQSLNRKTITFFARAFFEVISI